jgi:hypothetical protein
MPSEIDTAGSPATEASADRRGIALLTELHPKWRACSDRLAELLARKDAILQELGPLKAHVATTHERSIVDGGGVPRIPTPPPATDHPESVKAVLGDLLSPYEPRPVPQPASEVVRFRELKAEIEAIDEALPLLHRELAAAHREASRLVCDHIKSEYQEKIAGPVLDAMKSLAEAMIAHAGFRQDFVNVNLNTLAPLPITDYFGDAKDKISGLRQLLSFAAEVGHHSFRVPQHWRQE